MPNLIHVGVSIGLFIGLRLIVVRVLERSNVNQHMYYKATAITVLILLVIRHFAIGLSILGIVLASVFFLWRTYRNGYQ